MKTKIIKSKKRRASRIPKTKQSQLAEPKPGAARLKVIGNRIRPDHPNIAAGYKLLAEALGIEDRDFLNGLMTQIGNASADAEAGNEMTLNFFLSVIKGIKPKDQFEAMLAAQMAAIHVSTMIVVPKLTNSGNILQQDSADRAVNKLARTYAIQMEAFKRYRTGGEQTVTVQHVSVSEGGQAIVGNVTQHSSNNKAKSAVAPLPALTDAKAVPMRTINESKGPAAVPTRKARQE